MAGSCATGMGNKRPDNDRYEKRNCGNNSLNGTGMVASIPVLRAEGAELYGPRAPRQEHDDSYSDFLSRKIKPCPRGPVVALCCRRACLCNGFDWRRHAADGVRIVDHRMAAADGHTAAPERVAVGRGIGEVSGHSPVPPIKHPNDHCGF